MRDEETTSDGARACRLEDAPGGAGTHGDATARAALDEAREQRRASRRRFARTAAAALVAAPLAARLALAQTPPATREPAAPPKPEPSPSPQRPQQPPSPVALAYVELARARFGDKLNEEELNRLRRSFEGKARSGDALSKVKLQNSDEPDFVFSA
jgi:hypothetical protein